MEAGNLGASIFMDMPRLPLGCDRPPVEVGIRAGGVRLRRCHYQ